MKNLILILIFFALYSNILGQEVYMKPQGQTTSWVNFENQKGEKGAAAMENNGAKGHAFDRIAAGHTCTLLDKKGTGIVNRIWLTVSERDPEMLRSLQIDMYWDNEDKPAVSVPLGDFFCNGLAILTPFENCYFSNPEGRSFNTCIPMPFRKAARITLTNTSNKDLTHLFYDINLTMLNTWNPQMSYFHAYWNGDIETKPGIDHTILPRVDGCGRFLGVSMGIKTNKAYSETWWGEGEIKFYLDGDSTYPSLSGTGVEDYIGTAWGQGAYQNRYQGSPIGNEKEGQWSFYRFHVLDPIYFYSDIKVGLQQIGGGPFDKVLSLYKAGVPLIPVTVDIPEKKQFVKLFELEKTPALTDPDFPVGWVNFYRQDNIWSVAYFYLDKPAR